MFSLGFGLENQNFVVLVPERAPGVYIQLPSLSFWDNLYTKEEVSKYSLVFQILKTNENKTTS